METFTWQEIDGMIYSIASHIEKDDIDAIVGISRSGLIPAVMLSHLLDVRNFSILDIKRTDSNAINSKKSEPHYQGLFNDLYVKNKNILLVDDIVGAGETMKLAREILNPLVQTLKAATLVVNESNLKDCTVFDIVDYCGAIIHGWAIFPWEGKHLGGNL